MISATWLEDGVSSLLMKIDTNINLSSTGFVLHYKTEINDLEIAEGEKKRKSKGVH